MVIFIIYETQNFIEIGPILPWISLKLSISSQKMTILIENK